MLGRLRNRIKARFPIGSPAGYPSWRGFIPPRRLWVNPRDPLTHYLRWPWEYRAYLTLLCELRRDHAVLELGCNHGRTMLGLVDYLEDPGYYEGLDILENEIEYAQRHLRPRSFRAGFKHADIANGQYNAAGELRAERYVMPYGDEQFDVVYAASLFTHLLPGETQNYLAETARVLKPGGRALFSFFVLDHYRGPGTTTSPHYSFDHPLPAFPDAKSFNPDNPEDVLGYKMSSIHAMAADAGLAVEREVPGYWSKSHACSVNEQDLIVFTKGEADASNACSVT